MGRGSPNQVLTHTTRTLAKPVYLCARAAQIGTVASLTQCNVPPWCTQREPQGYAGLTTRTRRALVRARARALVKTKVLRKKFVRKNLTSHNLYSLGAHRSEKPRSPANLAGLRGSSLRFSPRDPRQGKPCRMIKRIARQNLIKLTNGFLNQHNSASITTKGAATVSICTQWLHLQPGDILCSFV